MKLSFLPLFLGTAFLAACGKPELSLTDDVPQTSGVIAVRIQTPFPESSKAATDAISDSKINSIQLFVFNDTGQLETSRYEAAYDGSQVITITTKTGAKTVYAVLNSARLNFTTLSKFETEATLEYNDLSENTPTSLLMVGKNSISVNEFDKNKNPSAAAQALTIRVKRLAAKVQLDQVTVNFDGTMLEGGELAIQDIYLVNVVGKSPYGVQSIGTEADKAGTGIPIALPAAQRSNMTNWYNKGSFVSGAPAVTFDQSLGEGFKCSGNYVKGTAKAMNRVFFAYPNIAEAYQTDANVTAPVHTALVIKGRLKSAAAIDAAIDKDTYYTFDLPALEANKVYQITNINLTMAGADNPGDRVTTGQVDGNVTVDDWTGNINLTYDF